MKTNSTLYSFVLAPTCKLKPVTFAALRPYQWLVFLNTGSDSVIVGGLLDCIHTCKMANCTPKHMYNFLLCCWNERSCSSNISHQLQTWKQHACSWAIQDTPGKNVSLGYQTNENNINSLHWRNVVLKRSRVCFKQDTTLKCLLQSTIPNAKEGKYNSKKAGGVEDSPQIAPTESGKGAESPLVFCGMTLSGRSQQEPSRTLEPEGPTTKLSLTRGIVVFLGFLFY